MNKFLSACAPRHVYKIFDIEHFDVDTGQSQIVEEYHDETSAPYGNTSVSRGVRLKGSSVTLLGKEISKLLSPCSKCILIAVTLGLEMDKLIHVTQLTDMSKALEYDSAANEAVEEYCNGINAELKNNYLSKKLYLTDRFSPGYGDFPLAQTRDICNLLDTTKTIGIWVNESDLMIPFKSITAVIGIASEPQPMRISGCASCMLSPNCKYRKAGGKCG